MNTVLAFVALLAASNPPRRRAALSTGDTTAVAIGAVMAAVLFTVLAATATPLIDALDVSAPNLRIAAGFALAIVAAHDLVRRVPPPGAALDGRRAALVPVFFPVLARPEVGLVALSVGADHGVALTAASAAIAMAAVVGWHALLTPRTGIGADDRAGVTVRVEHGMSALVAGAAVALGIAIIADGVFSI
jgi:small neutral amino acid transporter SnatA (MarC family)